MTFNIDVLVREEGPFFVEGFAGARNDKRSEVAGSDDGFLVVWIMFCLGFAARCSSFRYGFLVATIYCPSWFESVFSSSEQ